jgi:spermidine/putrescine ABC transporter ATP-binding subunit
MESPLVQLADISKSFGEVTAVQPLDITIRRGDFYAILGPSGCGKTTLLNLIAGFLFPDSGRIEIAGTDVTRMGPERRPTNMVFQGYGLFPHMTVRQNIAYGLRIRKTPQAEIEQRVGEVMELVHMEGFEGRSVAQLSGGQQQRVALARALIMRPQVLLLDEPLAALDLKLRKAMQVELRRIHHSIGGTFVFVTHDQSEAMGLADRIAVMESGRLVQEGSAEEIYEHPKTRFVSTFIGEANVFSGERRGGEVTLDIGPRFLDAGPDGPVVSVVRPEAMMLQTATSADSSNDSLTLSGRVEDIVYLGTYVRYTVAIGAEQVNVHSADVQLRNQIKIGSDVAVTWTPGDHRVLTGD